MTDTDKKARGPARDGKSETVWRDYEKRQKSYREQALKIYPWVCTHCGRSFSGKRLRELTVHHKDHDHDNNPPDGSNWELLCIYCHDHEHSKYLDEDFRAPASDRQQPDTSATHKPFAGLDKLIKDES